MKKKVISLCLCVCLLAMGIIGGTLAYFTDTETAENVFTVGDVKIELTETNWKVEDGETKEVYPGEALAKNPNIKNIGSNPCYVRIKVEGLDTLGIENMITYETNGVAGALGKGWMLGEDGYFYYTEILNAGEKTTDLFEQIRIPGSVIGGYDSVYAVIVAGEAVQVQGAEAAEGSDADKLSLDDIEAWFETCMK